MAIAVYALHNSTLINLVNNRSYNLFGFAKGLGIDCGRPVRNSSKGNGKFVVFHPAEKMEIVYTYDDNRSLPTICGTNTPCDIQELEHDA